MVQYPQWRQISFFSHVRHAGTNRLLSALPLLSLSAVLQATLRVLLLYTLLQVLSKTTTLLLPASHRQHVPLRLPVPASQNDTLAITTTLRQPQQPRWA